MNSLVALLLLAEPSSLEAVSNEQVALVERTSASVVFISTDQGFGSGFLVDDSGLILTNAHIIQKATAPRVLLHDGRKFIGRVVEVGAEDVDVALVQIDLPHAPALPLEPAFPRVGEWVGAVGHGSGALFTFNSGMISNVYADGAEKSVFQTQIPLNPGNSGGPIFNARGLVVGLVAARLPSATSINFGISVAAARRALKGLTAVCKTCLRVTVGGKVSVFVNGTLVGVGPIVVLPQVKEEPLEISAVVDGKMLKANVEFPKVRAVDLK
jgi:serine protease Do